MPNSTTNIVRVLTNTGAGRAFRAPQHPPASFGMESMMDLLAYKMGIDPLEFRRRNDPNEHRQEEYRIGAERFGWKEKFHPPGQGGSGPLKRGVGLACASWGSGGSGSKAECQIHPDGSVEVRCGTQDLGTGSRTVGRNRRRGDFRFARGPNHGAHRRYELSAQRRQRRQHDHALGRTGDTRRVRQRAERAE